MLSVVKSEVSMRNVNTFLSFVKMFIVIIIIIIIIAGHWWLSLFLKSNSDNATLSEGKAVSKTAQGLLAESMTSASHSHSFNPSQENLPADKFYKGQQPWNVPYLCRNSSLERFLQ